MIKNFRKIRDNLWRGAVPPLRDIIALNKQFGVTKIISLDKSDGDFIDPICRKLGINHIIVDLDPGDAGTLDNLAQYDIHTLLDPSIPTFVHCHRGKDRTGLLVALARHFLDGWSCREALLEARQLGFGTGLRDNIEDAYTNFIKHVCQEPDSNQIDDNLPDYMYRDEQVDPYEKSFAPLVDIDHAPYPYTPPYEGRENYGLQQSDQETSITTAPQVGVFDQTSQMTNSIGPSLVGGGFI